MPRPLFTLGHDELGLYADPLALHLLADAAEDRGLRHRTDLLRSESRLALLELLRGWALDDDECGRLAPRLAGQTTPLAVERQLSAALGTSRRGDALLGLLTPDGALDADKLGQQYGFQTALLLSLGLLPSRGRRL